MLTQVCVKMAEEIVLTGPKTSLQEDLTRLYSQGFLTDITLSTEDGKNFEAHRILLAARSHYFHSIVPRLKSEPVIFLKGVKGAHLDKILKYIYSGSVSLSRHQLKPILEVAKSLQVKGLHDANPAEILSRQGISGPSPSAVQSIASRTGGNPAVIAAMQARAQQQRQMVSPSSGSASTPPDKPPAFRPSSSSSNSLAANRAGKSKIIGSFRTHTDDSESDDEIIVNKSKPDTDMDDDDDDDDEDIDEDDESDRKTASTVVQSRAETPPKPKRKRGRPPKNKKAEVAPAAPTNESKGSDPYDFDAADDNVSTGATTTGQMRTMQASIADDKSKQWRLTPGKKSKEEEEEENAAAKREVKNAQHCF